ncbi:hypothetical protein KEJ18_05665 [Candidatus Bathyarchaeota archaeon]|nr:hypothetical protein [Candidatus Bathyarchaeota archaeon]
MSGEEEILPKMSEDCAQVLESVISALKNPLPYNQSKARLFLDVLYQKKCKEALAWIHEKYVTHPAILVQKIAKRALELHNRL